MQRLVGCFVSNLLALSFLVIVLSSCGHTPITRTIFDAIGQGTEVSSRELNPDLDYLRVIFQGNEALLVLGYLEPREGRVLATWYSSTGEVIQTQAGRITATRGLPVDWLSVRYQDLPAWDSLVGSNGMEFIRTRDQMPGYIFGIEEHILIKPVPAPPDAQLAGVDARSLLWFEEAVKNSVNNLPSARYGLKRMEGTLVVVYGEQCFDSNQCIAWQTWPPQP
jgi:hypothetical protein